MAKKFKTDARSVQRRQRVIERLEKQLKDKKKNLKVEGQPVNPVFTAPLEEKDVLRINKELTILRLRL